MPHSKPCRRSPTLAVGLVAASLCLGAAAWGAPARTATAPPATRQETRPAASPTPAQPTRASLSPAEEQPSTIGLACFGNGCGRPAVAAVPRNPARVDAAIRAGDAGAALAAGGGPTDVLAAWAAADNQAPGAGRGGASPTMIELMQAGRLELESADDDGEIIVRSYLNDGRSLMLRRSPTGPYQGGGGGGG